MKKIPKFATPDELVTFFDENDLGDYDLPEVHVEVDLGARRVRVRKDLYQKVNAVAHAKGTDPERILESWLEEKLEVEPLAG